MRDYMWQALPQSFIYPLWLNNIIAILLSSTLLLVSFSIPNHYAFYSSISILTIFWLKYLSLVFRHIAQGYQYSPKVALNFFMHGFESIVPLALFTLTIGCIHYLLQTYVPIQIMPLCYVALIAYIPAAVSLVLLNETYFVAINFYKIYKFIKTNASSYLLVIFTFSLAYLGLGKTLMYISYFIYDSALLFISICLYTYLSITMIHFIAKFVYLNHEKMGYNAEIALSEFSEKNSKCLTKPKVIITAEQHMMNGEFKLALTSLEEKLPTHIENTELQDMYFKLLQILGLQQKICAHTEQYINLLISHSKGLKAIQVFQDLQFKFKNIQLKNDKTIFELAKIARHYGKFQLAVDMFEYLLKNQPKSEYAPYCLWLLGKTLIERYANDSDGFMHLKRLCNEYPDHPIANKARAYPCK